MFCDVFNCAKYIIVFFIWLDHMGYQKCGTRSVVLFEDTVINVPELNLICNFYIPVEVTPVVGYVLQYR